MKERYYRIGFCLGVALLAACGKNTPSTEAGPSAEVPAPAVTETVARLDPNTPVSDRFENAVEARITDKYAIVIHADGKRVIEPLAVLNATDLDFLQRVAAERPFQGKAKVTVVKEETRVAKKETIVVSKTEAGWETVQLVSPAVFRDQIGATCMIYARVHWLDIAGYYVDRGDLYKIINNTPPDEPWLEPRYVAGLTGIERGFATSPISHPLPPGVDPFKWARGELRKGRAILAAFPQEIWRALPAGYLATRPWSGGDVGHQIVVNGFTWNPTTKEGTFHIVNTWAELPEFDIALKELRHGELSFERSLSPVGEVR